jgi:hypothetical protein
MFHNVFLQNSAAIREWATSVRNENGVLSGYTPVIDFPTMILSEFNSNFEVIVSKYNLSSDINAEEIIIEFTIRHTPTNNYTYCEARVPIDRLDINVLDTAWDSIKNVIEQSIMTILNNDINVGSIIQPVDFSTTEEIDTITSILPIAIETNYIHMSESRTIGSNGGSFLQGIWTTRIFNTLDTDIPHCITLNPITFTFTINPGVYSLSASCPAFNVHNHQIRLYNHTTSNTEKYGSNSYSNDSKTTSTLDCIFTVSAPTEFSIHHKSSKTQIGNGLGMASGFSTEMYSCIDIKKITKDVFVKK